MVGALSKRYDTTYYTTKLRSKVILASYFLERSMHEAVTVLAILVNMIQFC